MSVQQKNSTNLELVLQLWFALNMDAAVEHSGSQFDSSLKPLIPLSSAAISSLISALSW